MTKPGYPNLDEYVHYDEYYRTHVKDPSVSGEQMIARCCFHDDEHKSLSINLKTGKWNCKSQRSSCGSGNVIEFEAKILGVTNGQAYKSLCLKYEVPYNEGGNGNKKHRPAAVVSGPTPAQLVSNDLFISEETWDKFQKPADDWKEIIYKLRGWTAGVIDQMDVRIASYYCTKTGKVRVAGARDRIAIPVRDKDGKLRNIRSYHPRPPEGVSKIMSWATGYGGARNFPVTPRPEGAIYLVEGEPDCLCALSNGINAITHTTKPNKYNAELLEPFKGRDVVVCYDADKPGQAYALLSAVNVAPVAATVRFLEWPIFMGRLEGGSWPDKHGEDLTDFFVKHKKTVEEFNALPTREYKEAEVKAAIKANESASTSIHARDLCYWYNKVTKETVDEVKLSNFVIDIKRSFQDPDPAIGIIRVAQFISAESRSKVVNITPSHLSSMFEFRKLLFGSGKFILTQECSETHFRALTEHVIMSSDARVVIRPDHIGWIGGEHQLWLYRSVAIKNGKIYMPDEEGITWIDNNGYMPLSLSAQSDSNVEEDLLHGHLPDLRVDISDYTIDTTRKDVVRLFKDTSGSFGSYLLLGFVASCVYAEEIFKQFRLPILLLYGEAGAGKNSLINVLMGFWGLSEAIGQNLSQVTAAGIMRMMAYYSDVPVWVDDYRSSIKNIGMLESILRTAYDRIGASRGRLGFGINYGIVRSPLIITGESLSADSALSSRCAQVQLSKTERGSVESLNKLKHLKDLLPAITLKLTKEKSTEKVAALIAQIGEYADLMIEAQVDPRIANVYATLAACFTEIMNPEDSFNDVMEFVEWVGVRSTETVSETKDTSLIGRFTEAMVPMLNEGLINKGRDVWYREELAASHVRQVEIWMSVVYEAYTAWCRRRGYDFETKNTIISYFKSQPYFIGRREHRKFNGQQRRVVALDADLMPLEMQQLFRENFGEAG